MMPDLDKMTTDDLEKLLDGGEKAIAAAVVEDAPAPEVAAPSPPPEPEKPAEEKEPEPEPEQEEEEEEDSRITELRLSIEEQSLRNQRLESELERQRLIASREAGRAGHFKQVSERAPARERADDEEPSEEGPPRSDPRVSDLEATIAELKSEAASRAFTDEYLQFSARRPETKNDVFLARMQEHVQSIEEEFSDDLHGRDMKLARQTARTVFEAAYVETKLEMIGATREQMKTKKAEQFAQVKAAKQTAAIAGSGATPAPKSQDKPLAESSLQELEAQLVRMTQG
jgi:hypothetical protein